MEEYNTVEYWEYVKSILDKSGEHTAMALLHVIAESDVVLTGPVIEKVADYITFIHCGEIIMNTTKDELIYEYGIIRCGQHLFEQISKEDIVAYRKQAYQYEVLVKDKKNMAKKYSDAVIDTATIDEIMLLSIKGVRI